MATDYTADPFDEWAEPHQQRWFDMVENARSERMANDDTLQWFYDVAFSEPKGGMRGDHRYAFMQAMDQYMQEEYDVHLLGPESVFDWDSWRDFYESTSG